MEIVRVILCVFVMKKIPYRVDRLVSVFVESHNACMLAFVLHNMTICKCLVSS